MSLLKCVVSYQNRAEADIDKSLLESRGIIANVMNAGLGSGFIELQVTDERYEEAVSILRAARPERFGSPAAVQKIEKGIRRQAVRLALLCLICSLVLFLFIDRESPILERLWFSICLGTLSAFAITLIHRQFKKNEN